MVISTRFTICLVLVLVSFPAGLTARQSSPENEEQAKAIEYFVEGIASYENEEYERALDQLMAAHLILSDNPGINYALSDVYLATGDYNNAAYYGQIAAEQEPENKWYQLNMADIYRLSGRMEMAIQSLQNVLEYHPRDLDVLYTLAEAYLEIGKLEESNETLDRILHHHGSIFEVHLRKFQNFNALGQTDNALAELESMRETNPDNLGTLLTLSQYYLELDKPDIAEEILLDARNRHPHDPRVVMMLSEIYISDKAWEHLGTAMMELIEEPLVAPDKKMELVRFLYMQQQNHPGEPLLAEQAGELIRRFSEEEPEYGPAQLIAADYFMQRNEPEMALEKLDRAVEIMPDNGEAWGQRMQVLFSLGRYEEVIDLSETANESAPDNAHILFFTGTSYLLTGNHQQAEEWLEEAALAPSRRSFRSVIYGTLGDVKHDLDKWEEAVEAYERSLELDRNNHNTLNNYAYYLSLKEERLSEALEMSERAVSIEPGNAAYLDTFGWIHFKIGNYDRAREYIHQSIETGNASAEVYEHLGDVYEALGEPETAKKWWQQALDKDPERTYLQERM